MCSRQRSHWCSSSTLPGSDHLNLIALAGTPVVILLFKVAGLYDREQLRLLRSTLDEAPTLLQLAGLYALSIAILHPFISPETVTCRKRPDCRAVADQLPCDHGRAHSRAVARRTRVRQRALPRDR